MARLRKTRDCWRFYLNYWQGCGSCPVTFGYFGHGVDHGAYTVFRHSPRSAQISDTCTRDAPSLMAFYPPSASRAERCSA